MIIDFTIQNFLSIKDAQTFSMYTEHAKQHLACHVAYPARDKIGVLRSAGIYGANAAGKSNVLAALLALQFIACYSGDLKDGVAIPVYQPYRLAQENKQAPIELAIEFFDAAQVRYSYWVAFNQQRILEEVLDYYPSRQKANLFTRHAQDTWESIHFGARYKGGMKRIPFFANNSYLSKAGENAAASDVVRSAYKYLKSALRFLSPETRVVNLDLYENAAMIAQTARFLSNIDTGISGIKVQLNEQKMPHPLTPDRQGFFGEATALLTQKISGEFLFAHQTEEGEIEFFEEKMESAGTRKLFQLAPMLIDAFAKGNVLIWDEIDSSFHPHIAEMLIKLFNDGSININNAQLIFTTHNTSLMHAENLRRDQIWFTEKKNGATSLYSLDEFDKSKVKANSPFQDWYNAGRFDAIPAIDYLALANLLRPKKAKEDVNGEANLAEGMANA